MAVARTAVAFDDGAAIGWADTVADAAVGVASGIGFDFDFAFAFDWGFE